MRESPNVKGFLMLGNMTGLWYSRDSGDHWQQVKAGFPTVPVFDVKFMDHDLAVATHGRGLFVFDDIRPFEEMDDKTASQDFHLFGAGDGTHYVTWFRGGETQVGYSAPDAPGGVVLDYYMPEMDGGVVAETMRRERPEVPIMLLSAYINLPAEVVELADVTVLKGEGPQELLDKLHAMLLAAGTNGRSLTGETR